ncbi:hypothetical protein M422DRAFT_259002 [Sphaerobolus stellatus SS14]|uniref:Uncharacterized protein n=1 Tax=Sphaerobolus stellatus (strain SS14) TaxID=990650 RepID=A0A0C9VKS2_SPHS4|nr:hypothetical protein M422DRAFT_259002 [Sphaerobolus stellatus SS14]
MSSALPEPMETTEFKLTLERLLVPERYPTNPHEMKLSKTEWEAWFKQQCIQNRWNLKKEYISKPKSNRNIETAKKHDLSPHKQRNRGLSIKVQCNASIYTCQEPGKDTVSVKFNWEHTGNDPTSTKDLGASRNAEAVHEWLNEYELKEITPDSECMPYSLKISPMDIYNAIHRKIDVDTRLSPSLNESLEAWVQRLDEEGWVTLYEKIPGEEARNGFTLGLCSPWQKKLIGEYGDTVCLDSTHNMCRGEDNEKIFLTTILA